jgi:hypothetical protein
MSNLQPFVLLVCLCLTWPAEAATKAGHVEWALTFSCGTMNEGLSSIVRWRNGRLFVVGRSSAWKGDDPGPKFEYKSWVWQIDESGKRLSEKEFDLVNPMTGAGIDVEKFIPVDGKGTFLVHEMKSRPNYLHTVKITDAGEMTLVGSCESKTGFPRAAAATSDGIIVAGGDYSNNHDAWLMKIDAKGQKIWEKTYDNKRDEEIIGLAATGKGEIVFAANSGSNNKFGAGECNVWVVKCDKDGKVLAKTTFPGRHPGVAVSNEEAIAVVYNRENFPKQDICAVGLDGKLHETWRLNGLVTDNIGVGLARIVAGVPDGFAVACGSKGPVLLRISEKGKLLWEESIPLPENAISVTIVETVLAGKGDYYLNGHIGFMPVYNQDPNGTRTFDTKADRDDVMVARIRE